ncbi:MAG TPA: hypothetical protein VIH03_00820 [Nitrososphaerales archaeon]
MENKTVGLLGAVGATMGYLGFDRFSSPSEVTYILGLWLVAGLMLALTRIYGIRDGRTGQIYLKFLAACFAFSFSCLFTIAIGSGARAPGIIGAIEVMVFGAMYFGIGLLINMLILRDRDFQLFLRNSA